MSSNQIWILLALLGAPVSNWVESRLSNWLEQLKSADFLDMQMLASAPLLIALLVGVLILATALVLMALSGLLAIVRFHGYRLLLDTDRFKARFGLLDVREKTLRVSKLHSIEIAQTAIGRVLGQWYAVGHQTGANPLNQERRFLIPGIDDKRVAEVVGVLRDHDWQMPDWQGINARFRSLLWMRISAVLVAAAAVLWQLLPGHPVWPSAAVLAVNAVVLVCVHLRWRRWAYALDDRRLRIRSGLVGQKILEFDLARCQQVRITASPYQRRHRLASLNIRLPHGEQAIPWLPRDVADRIANLLLYRAETSAEHGL